MSAFASNQSITSIADRVGNQLLQKKAKITTAESCTGGGIAGPEGGSAGKPVGTVWVCWITPETTRVEQYQLQGDRQAVREQVIKISLQELLHQLN